MCSNTINKYILAVECGGTKCEALLVRSDGEVLGWGRCGYADPGSGRGMVGSGRAEETVLTAVQQAIGNTKYDELHVVGSSFSDIRKLIDKGRIDAVQFIPVGETAAAFSLAGLDYGVVAVIGTGSLVYGRARNGREITLDGLGPLLGDYGSGYHIGFLAIRAAARSGWHPSRHTTLAEIVFRECVGKEPDPRGSGLVGYMLDPRDRAEVAHLARFVDIEAAKGDKIAISILREAASAAAETVHDLVIKLDMLDEDYVMAGVGGVVAGSGIYWQHLCERVAEFAPRLQFILPSATPVVGLAMIALKELSSVAPAILREKLFAAVSTNKHLTKGT